MKLRVDGKNVSIDPRTALGKGGEAEVYAIDGGLALKVYKAPDHPDYENLPAEQSAAARRIDAVQEKLPEFPRGIHARVVEPLKLALDAAGRIAGYCMRKVDGAEPLFRFGDRAFRAAAGIRNAAVTALFRELHGAVLALHRGGIVIGDFNDLNVLVRGMEPWLIDADSFQFGRFLCPMYTLKFVDPLRCDPKAATPTLIHPHTSDSDWYAFAVLLMQSLLYVHPYGGVYRPKDASDRIAPDARAMKRITVFHPEVLYPKPALHFSILPDETLDLFQRVFIKDERGEFPARAFDALEWSVCPHCGAEHARRQCPKCVPINLGAPTAIKTVTRVRGTVTATRVFKTDGEILYATLDPIGGRPKWIVHENGAFLREDGAVLLRGNLDARLRFRIMSAASLIGRDNQFATLHAGGRVERTSCDGFRNAASFDTNGQRRFWLHAGQLLGDGPLGPEFIGDVLAGQTAFWAGPKFGFGCYRAGGVQTAFVFDARRRGINDRVKLPPIKGELLDMACRFGAGRCWVLTASHEGHRRIHRCVVVTEDGAVIATAECDAGDGSWLGQLHTQCAAGDRLFAPTDEGIVRLSADRGTIAIDREFPDTEPFVDSNHQLFVSSSCIFAVSRREIVLLGIS